MNAYDHIGCSARFSALSEKYVFVLLSLSIIAATPVPAEPMVAHGEVTDRIEWLGTPYEHIYPDYHPELIYARNVWDIVAFNGRLYLGAGNSNNSGPAVNAGPLPIIYFDPSTGEFKSEWVVDDEQIDRYLIIDGDLIIPGHDPTQSWSWGNFYRLEDEGWKKYRNIPEGIHNYSMISHAGRLFAGLGTRDGAAVSVSEDNGQTWVNHLLPGARVYALLRSRNQLFASGLFVRWHPSQLERMAPEHREQLLERYRAPMAEWDDGQWNPRPDLDLQTLFPSTKASHPVALMAKIVKPVDFQGSAIYIGGRTHNGHQFMPIGLFAAASLEVGNPRVKALDAVTDVGDPWDHFVRDERLHVLVSRRRADGAYRVAVLETADLEHWTEVLNFRAPTFARSFEMLDGAYYFGLGSEVANPAFYQIEELRPETGRLLRFDPRQSSATRLLADVRQPESFIAYLVSHSKHTEPERRGTAHGILREFVSHHDPNRPLDRSQFLRRMQDIFNRSGDCADREAALRILILHTALLDAETRDRLLAVALEDSCVKLQALASMVELSGLSSDVSHAFLRDFHGFLNPTLQNALFSEAVNRDSPAFPVNRPAEDFEQIETVALPLEGWRFTKDPSVGLGYLKGWFDPAFEDGDWRSVAVGDFWASFLGDLYIGVGWYRLNWEAPVLPDHDALGLHFGGVDENAWVWVNGHAVGQHNIGMDGWDKPFQLDVTGILKPGDSNQITVRVKNTRANGGIWKPLELRVSRVKENPPPEAP